MFMEKEVNHFFHNNCDKYSGIYELLLIQKKSMRVQDYKKKVESFDNLTDNKPIETIEEIVNYTFLFIFIFFKNSSGEMLHSAPLFMVLISKVVYLMMVWIGISRICLEF